MNAIQTIHANIDAQIAKLLLAQGPTGDNDSDHAIEVALESLWDARAQVARAIHALKAL